MRKSFKNTWLSICLLASVAMVGCGGGGGGGGAYVPSNTQAPEAQTAQSVVNSSVVPVVNNFSTILNGGVATTFRPSTSANVEVLSNNEIGNSIVTALEAPQLLRAVITAAGGNIKGGLWNEIDQKSYYSSYIEVASYSGNVYERTIYLLPYGMINYGEDIELSLKEIQELGEISGHYVIEGCNAVLDNNILKSLTLNSNAKITIEEFQEGSKGKKYKSNIKGTIDSDLSVKWSGDEKAYNDSEPLIISMLTGEKPSDNDYYAIKVSKKITSNTIYSLSKPIKIKFSKFYVEDNKSGNVNYSMSDYSTEETQTLNDFSSENIEVTISGISGSITDSKVSYNGVYVQRNYQTQEWKDNGTAEYTSFITFKEKPEVNNLKFASPVKISLSGSLNNNESSQTTTTTWIPEYSSQTSEPSPVAKRNASIKNITISLNKVSGNIDTIVVSDAEAHIEIDNYSSDEVIMVGDQKVAFNKAKIDVTGLKYNYTWKPTAEKYGWDNNTWTRYKNEEYNNQANEMKKNCFGNAIVKISASESKNNVDITANCDINKKTATAHLVNNGNTYKLKDVVTEFDFRTLDINATTVDVLADNNCEGAELVVTCVEKNNSTTKRNYKVVNGKLVRSDLPQEVAVDVPTEIQEVNSNKIESEIAELPPEELKPVETKDGSELKVAKKDGKSIATYNKGKETDKVKVQTNIIAMTNTIFATSFFTDNDKIYTILFVVENKNGKKLINGSIFNGKQPGLDSRDRYNGDFAKFNCSDGKKLSVLPIKGTAFDISLP